MDVRQELDEKTLKMLRETNQIGKDEIAYRMGDLVVVENVVTSQKRTLDAKNLSESFASKQLLLD